MSRLLFAAARGARIQYQINPTAPWEPIVSGWIPGFATGYYRIHPEDAHLAYGPISTALRDHAANPKNLTHFVETLPPYVGYQIGHETQEELLDVYLCDTLTHSLFLLILAEALADEGL